MDDHNAKPTRHHCDDWNNPGPRGFPQIVRAVQHLIIAKATDDTPRVDDVIEQLDNCPNCLTVALLTAVESLVSLMPNDPDTRTRIALDLELSLAAR